MEKLSLPIQATAAVLALGLACAVPSAGTAKPLVPVQVLTSTSNYAVLAHDVMMVAVSGDIPTLSKLVAQGADIDAASNSGWHAIHWAAAYNQAEVIELLLEKGANSGRCVPGGFTPLMIAAQHGSLEAINLLLSRNVDVNCQNDVGATALTIASFHDYPQIVEMLLEAGALPNIANFRGETPLMHAAQRGSYGSVYHLLSKNAEVDRISSLNSTALNLASQDGHLYAMRLLLDAGADINLPGGPSNWTPLMFAVGNNEIAATKFLIERNAKIDLSNSDGWNPLRVTLNAENFALAELLIERGANPNYRANGVPLLVLFSQKQQNAAFEFLLQNGADPDLADQFGQTALFMAIANGNRSAVQNLLHRGVDTDRARKADKLTPLLSATVQGHFHIVKDLLEAGADIDRASGRGNTPLVMAIAAGKSEIAHLLVESGADLFGRDRDGSSILGMAIDRGDLELAKLIINRGGGVNIVDLNRWINNESITSIVKSLPILYNSMMVYYEDEIKRLAEVANISPQYREHFAQLVRELVDRLGRPLEIAAAPGRAKDSTSNKVTTPPDSLAVASKDPIDLIRTYRGKDADGDPVAFLDSVRGEYEALDRYSLSDVRGHDGKLIAAIYYHCRKNNLDPADVLPPSERAASRDLDAEEKLERIRTLARARKELFLARQAMPK